MTILSVSVLFLLFSHCTTAATVTLSKPVVAPLPVVGTECTGTNRCLSPDFCRVCPDGWGPSCAGSTCILGRCVTIQPCSQSLSNASTTAVSSTTSPSQQCTQRNTSRCVTNRLCALCVRGHSPACTEAVCVNGQCKVIAPCSIGTSTLTKTTTRKTATTPRTMVTKTMKKITTSTPINGCTLSSQCLRRSICVANCSVGLTPLCASAKCVQGKCITINPCSQRICETTANCPFKPGRCAACIKGYGPTCEQAACNCGVCAVVPPCSKQLATITPVPAVPDI